MRAALGALMLVLASPVQAQYTTLACPANVKRLLRDHLFRRYPAKTERLEPVAPIVRTGGAAMFRTIIRQQARLGPNFAGHYTIVHIGCGAATVCPAIVDARTGKVFFVPELGSATALLVFADIDVETLNYRRSSRLLVVVGTPNENESRGGVSYYVWRSGKLSLLRFIPLARICTSN